MLKICLVTPSLQVGGMQRVLSELANFFSRKSGIEVHLIIYGSDRNIFYNLHKEIIIHLPDFEFVKEKRLFSILKTLKYLRNEINKIKPDSILSFGELWNSFVLLSLLGLDYPIYISDRCSPLKKFGIFHSLIRKWLYPRANGIIAQTEIAKEIYQKKFPRSLVCVIGNPIKMMDNKSELKKENIVLTVGRLIDSKNHDKLIELFVKMNIPDWRLLIVGEDVLGGNNYEKLLKLIADFKAQGRVLLAGKQKDVERHYFLSSIFAFMSDSEGFPNVIAEAQCAGLPVVAFDCIAGPSEIVKNGLTGFLIPLNNYSLFEEKLKSLMLNKDLCNEFGRRAQEYIRQFDVENIGEKYLSFICK